MASCIICGEVAEVEVPDGEYKYFAVCAKHVYPVWRIQLTLAVDDLKAAIFDTPPFRQLERFMAWLARLLPPAD